MAIPATGNFIDVYRLPALDTIVATPDAPYDVSFMDELNGTGAGSFKIPLDDSAYGDIEINDIAAIRSPDGDTVGALLIEEIHEHTLDPDEGGALYAEYSGRLASAMLEWAVIDPALGVGHKPVEEDAVFDWRSPRYDPGLDSWAAATEVDSVADAEAGSWPTQPMAERFDLTVGAEMIAEAGATTSLAGRFWRLFYRDITIATPGRYGIEMLMDNLGFFWVDGIQQYEVLAEDGFKTGSFKRLELSAGTHRFTWAVYNFEDEESPGDGQGPAALAYNLYKADLQDFPLDPPDDEHWVSDSNTFVLYTDDDPWPGMTIGDIASQLLDEADARGTLTHLAATFDADDDSDANAFGRAPGLTTKTGFTTLLQFLQEMAATGRIEFFRVRPDGVSFDIYAQGYTNRPTFSAPYTSGLSLTAASGGNPLTGQLLLLDRRVT